MTEHRKPLDAALDLTVYAPIGFALEARKLLPSLVERGRQQVTMAKMVGKFAVAQGQVSASKQITKVQEQAGSVLAEFGLGATPPGGSEPEDVAPSAPPADDVVREEPTLVAVPDEPAPAAGSLPIAGYDSLAASQVIPRLDGLAADELAAVRRYEEAHRGRKTILGKIDQLTAE